MANKIQFRRDTAANWTSANPTLSQGELGFETDTNKFKIGNGSTAWNSLAYTYVPDNDPYGSDQALYTTSTVEFANATVDGTLTVDRLAKYGIGYVNIELTQDNNLTPQTDLRSDLGISSKKFGNLYVNTATISSKVVFPDASQQSTAYPGAATLALSTLTNGSYKVVLDSTGQLTLPSSTQGSITAGWITGSAGVGVNAGGNLWNFALDGTLTSPYNVKISTTGVTFPDTTNQTTAWTGSVSTSSVTGLSTVGYTGNYNDLSNKPTIPGAFDLSTVTNQGLFSTSTVTFGGLAITTGTKVTQTLSAGGYPLDTNGQALIRAGSTQSSALLVSNWTSGLQPNIYVRAYGQNRPGNSSTTAGNPSITFEGSRGTNSSPTALQANDAMGGFGFGGYDGTAWTVDRMTGTPNAETTPFQFVVQATENWAGNATTATNMGTRMFMRTQPQGVRLTSDSRQMFMVNSWTAGSTATNTPPNMNLLFGSGIDGSAPLLQPSGGVGSYNTGFGHTKVQFLNSQVAVLGVPGEATTPGSGCDNPSITATNYISIVTGRRSAVSGRRDALLANDTVGGLAFYAQTAANGTQFGSNVGNISVTMLENAGSTARGTKIGLQTVNSGTTTLSTKLRISDAVIEYNSDRHNFYDKTQTFPALSVTTATATFTAIPVMPVYTAATKPASGAVGQMICISDSAGGGNPNGMMAFWDTTNSRWSYIHDNTAV